MIPYFNSDSGIGQLGVDRCEPDREDDAPGSIAVTTNRKAILSEVQACLRHQTVCAYPL